MLSVGLSVNIINNNEADFTLYLRGQEPVVLTWELESENVISIKNVNNLTISLYSYAYEGGNLVTEEGCRMDIFAERSPLAERTAGPWVIDRYIWEGYGETKPAAGITVKW